MKLLVILFILKVYKYYEIATSEDSYRVRSNTVVQNKYY